MIFQILRHRLSWVPSISLMTCTSIITSSIQRSASPETANLKIFSFSKQVSRGFWEVDWLEQMDYLPTFQSWLEITGPLTPPPAPLYSSDSLAQRKSEIRGCECWQQLWRACEKPHNWWFECFWGNVWAEPLKTCTSEHVCRAPGIPKSGRGLLELGGSLKQSDLLQTIAQVDGLRTWTWNSRESWPPPEPII